MSNEYFKYRISFSEIPTCRLEVDRPVETPIGSISATPNRDLLSTHLHPARKALI